MTALPAAPGDYLLVFERGAETVLRVGKLGTVTLPAGRYAYVGSAHGPGGLRARLERHLRPAKIRHWHIDALTLEHRPDRIFFRADPCRGECAWVRALLALPGAAAPIRGFGSSDCREGCPAHLVRLPDGAGGEAGSWESRMEDWGATEGGACAA